MRLPSVLEEAVQLITVEAEEAYSNNNINQWKEKRSEAKQLLESNGYIYVGSGDYRMVYRYPDKMKVIKIPKFNLGKKENMSEHENWDRAPKEIKNYLAEIYGYDWSGKWLVQEYLPTDSCSKNEAKQLRKRLRNNNFHIDEIDVWNVGKRNDGTIVAFDYAGNY